MAQTCNPTEHLVGLRQGNCGLRPAQQKVNKTHLKNKPDVMVHTCNPSYSGGKDKRITV
jgi:hypothetical protein